VISEEEMHRFPLDEKMCSLSRTFGGNSLYAASKGNVYIIKWDSDAKRAELTHLLELPDPKHMVVGLHRTGDYLLVRREKNQTSSFLSVNLSTGECKELEIGEGYDVIPEENLGTVYAVNRSDGRVSCLDMASGSLMQLVDLPGNFNTEIPLKSFKDERGHIFYNREGIVVFDNEYNLLRNAGLGYDILFRHDGDILGFRGGRAYYNGKVISVTGHSGESRADLIGDRVLVLNTATNKSSDLFSPVIKLVSLARLLEISDGTVEELFVRTLYSREARLHESLSYHDARLIV